MKKIHEEDGIVVFSHGKVGLGTETKVVELVDQNGKVAIVCTPSKSGEKLVVVENAELESWLKEGEAAGVVKRYSKTLFLVKLESWAGYATNRIKKTGEEIEDDDDEEVVPVRRFGNHPPNLGTPEDFKASVKRILSATRETSIFRQHHPH